MVKRKQDGAVDRFSADRNFVIWTRLYASCEKSGGLHLAEPSLTAGRQAGWLVAEIWARLEILKVNFPLCLAEVLHYFSNFDAFIMLFPGKHFYKVL